MNPQHYEPIFDITKPLSHLDKLVPNYYIPREPNVTLPASIDWRNSKAARYIYPGALHAAVSTTSWSPTVAVTLQAVYATVGLPPDVGHTWFDVKRNGVSMLSGKFLTILRDTYASEVLLLGLPILSTDIITVDVAEDHGAKDATIYLMFK